MVGKNITTAKTVLGSSPGKDILCVIFDVPFFVVLMPTIFKYFLVSAL